MARIGIIPDSLADLDNPEYTTCLLIEAFLAKGHEVAVTTVDDLYLHNDQAHAKWRKAPFGELPPTDVSLAEHDFILMRKDPPFNEAYINALFVLDHANTKVFNDPSALRRASEKVSPLYWPDITPETYVSKSPEFIKKIWLEEKCDWVLKPVGSYDSRGVLKLEKNDASAEGIIEKATHNGNAFIIIQKFIPAVADGEKRILLLDGKPAGWFKRTPKKGGFLVPTQHGGQSSPCDLDARDHEIIEKIAPQFCVKTGFPFVGLDIIGGFLTEINLTSPSGLIALNRFTNGRYQDKFADFFLSLI